MADSTVHSFIGAVINGLWAFVIVGVIVWIVLFLIGLVSEAVRVRRDRAALVIGGIAGVLTFLAALS